MSIRKSKVARHADRPWVYDYKDQEGGRHQPRFRTRKEAEEERTRISGEVHDGTHTPTSATITVAYAAQSWLVDCRRKKRTRSTISNYTGNIGYINRLIGSVKLAKLTRPMVNKFRDDLVDEGRSIHLANKELMVLKAIISHAADRGWVAQNVARGVKGFETEPRKLMIGVDIPTVEEVNTLIRLAETCPSQVRGRAGPCSFRALMITAAFTGMRLGELTALEWDPHVDFENNLIHVRQGVNRWSEFGKPKTPNAIRDVPMMPTVVNTLRQWQPLCPRRGRVRDFETPEHKVAAIVRMLEADPKITNDAVAGLLGVAKSSVSSIRKAMPISLNSCLWLVFPSQRGDRPIAQSSICMQFLKLQRKAGIVDAAGQPKYNFHKLRHFFASVALSSLGWPIERVSGYLGHANTHITWKVYHHLIPDPGGDQARFAAAEEKFLVPVTRNATRNADYATSLQLRR